MHNYIKLNDNYHHLSLGNLFNAIKDEAKNKTSAIQSEIFCLIFNVPSIADTTVGNYCTGYRAIGNEYKQIYLNYQKKYQKDKEILIPIIDNIISIMEGYIYEVKNIDEINEVSSLQKLVHHMHNLAKNDIYVPSKFKKELLNDIDDNNYYEALCHILFYVVLEKKQPLYEADLVLETIEEILKNTNMSVDDLKKYLEIGFKEGINFIPSLKKLADDNNPYALYELGNKEYKGEIAGYPRYEEAYKYHQLAASFNHPTAYWMLSHMILSEKIGSMSDDDISLAIAYLEKAIALDSVSALNTMGLCYLNGWNKEHLKDIEKAKDYFEKAANKGYIYGYNNLGRVYEMKKDYKNALSYYLKSADLEESWACNKVGLYYYNGIGIEKDLQKAFDYFTMGANAPIGNRNKWNAYNLVVLFYLKGNAKLGIRKDLDKAISLLESISNQKEAKKLLLYTYYEKYLIDKSANTLNNVKKYLAILNDTLDKKEKTKIENELNEIYNHKINIKL